MSGSFLLVLPIVDFLSAKSLSIQSNNGLGMSSTRILTTQCPKQQLNGMVLVVNSTIISVASQLFSFEE